MKQFQHWLVFFSLGLQEALLKSVLLRNAFSGPQTRCFPPPCPSVTPLLARRPLLPLAMAYDLVFWCPFLNLYAICRFIPEVMLFISRCHSVWSHGKGPARHAYCNPTQMYKPQSLYTYLWVCTCVYVCLLEGRKEETRRCFAFKDPTLHRYEDTWNNFSLKLFVQMCEKRSNAASHVEFITFPSRRESQINPEDLEKWFKCFLFINQCPNNMQLRNHEKWRYMMNISWH